MLSNRSELTEKIRAKALSLGFDACGFARARRLENEERRLEEWLKQQRHATMHWMENHFDKRVDPTLLVPGSKTVVSVLASYHHPSHKDQIKDSSGLKIAKYAQGRDYHKVVKKKLKKLFHFTREMAGDVQGRFFVDSAPVLDKAWAVQAGLGWIGKNSNLLNKQIGSYFFIGEMIIDLETSYDSPVTDHCGHCTRCMDACPTNAIYEPYRVDATRCISYLTIEHDGPIAEKYHRDMENWIFGCDICQDVCPWNSKAITATFSDLHPRPWVTEPSDQDWFDLTPDSFDRIFEGSPVRRTKFEGLSRNIRIAEKQIK